MYLYRLHTKDSPERPAVMTATAALIAATLLAVPFWPTTGRGGAETTLQEVSDGVDVLVHGSVHVGDGGVGVMALGGQDRGRDDMATDGHSTQHPCEVVGGCYVHALTAAAVPVDGLDPVFLTESVPIVKCESTHREGAVNPTSGTRGLLQIHPIHIRRIERMGYTWDDMLTAEANLRVGASIHAEQGWRPWSCAR